MQFRLEFFNLFNHANLTHPFSNISSATVGRIQSNTVSADRGLMLARLVRGLPFS